MGPSGRAHAPTGRSSAGAANADPIVSLAARQGMHFKENATKYIELHILCADVLHCVCA
jgi:hypothetical protein